SLNATSLDENIVLELWLNKNDKNYPDVAVVISDVENLKRNLLLFTQIKELKIPAILVINMADRMKRKGITLDIERLEQELHTKIAVISTRKDTGIEDLKEVVSNYRYLPTNQFIDISTIDAEYFGRLQNAFPNQNLYK